MVTMTNEPFPVLYILMRDDLVTMNPGKAMAQASHASNAFIKTMLDRGMSHDEKGDYDDIDELGKIWAHETTQGFGTVLTLAVNEEQMRSAVKVAKAVGFTAEIIHDPSYPMLIPTDLGKILYTIHNEAGSTFEVGENFNYLTVHMDTCAYIFGDKNDPLLASIVGRFPLHP